MKRYNVYKLYVVELNLGNKVYYYICSHSNFTNKYIEIFSKMEIPNSIISNVEPLLKYYYSEESLSSPSESLKSLEQSNLLNKYININIEARLDNDEEKIFQNDINKPLSERILEEATTKFFPQNGHWYNTCFKKPQELNMEYLPCHLRDDEWLAKMLKKNQNLFFMSNNKILNFIKNSSFFQEKRHDYELEIVKWQIEWMKSGGENWIVDDKYGGDLVFLSPLCDIGFRKGIIDTLSKIGMNIDAIEEGIEKHANMWRDSFMNKAFTNEYEPVFYDMIICNFFDEGKRQEEKPELEPVDQEFKEKWLKMRKYEYYQRHKNSVDKYGVVEQDMQMSEEEVNELKLYLSIKSEERKKQLEDFGKKPGQVRL